MKRRKGKKKKARDVCHCGIDALHKPPPFPRSVAVLPLGAAEGPQPSAPPPTSGPSSRLGACSDSADGEQAPGLRPDVSSPPEDTDTQPASPARAASERPPWQKRTLERQLRGQQRTGGMPPGSPLAGAAGRRVPARGLAGSGRRRRRQG